MRIGKEENRVLADKKLKTDELLKCVSELDIDETTKNSVLSFIGSEQPLKGLRLLQQYRGEILKELHSEQNRLYQIDFVLQKAR